MLSPTTPVVTGTATSLPSRRTVRLRPASAWLGTLIPFAWSITTSAEALIPGRIPSADWVTASVTG